MLSLQKLPFLLRWRSQSPLLLVLLVPGVVSLPFVHFGRVPPSQGLCLMIYLDWQCMGLGVRACTTIAVLIWVTPETATTAASPAADASASSAPATDSASDAASITC